jgi:hypothetical protein
VKVKKQREKQGEIEFCPLVTWHADGAGKSFKNLGLRALPSFTHLPNRLI